MNGNGKGDNDTPVTVDMNLPDEVVLLRARYQRFHETFHKMWTAAVGQPGYDKMGWLTMDNLVTQMAGQALKALGHAGEPLL